MMQRLWLFFLLFVTKKPAGDFHFALPGAFACRYMCFCECAVSTLRVRTRDDTCIVGNATMCLAFVCFSRKKDSECSVV